jgi:hypothetical protein
MKVYFMKNKKILFFHCIYLYFYQYTWLNFTKFDFEQTLYVTYFEQEGVYNIVDRRFLTVVYRNRGVCQASNICLAQCVGGALV